MTNYNPNDTSAPDKGTRTRRRLLRLATASVASLAGCADIFGPAGPTTPDGSESGNGTDSTATPSPTETPTATTTADTGTDWPRFHRDAANTDLVSEASNLTSSLAQQWSISRGDPQYGLPTTPILANDTLFFGSSEGSLYAVDPSTGAEQWAVELISDGSIESPPTYVDGTLYVNDGGYFENRLHAVDAETGEVMWSEVFGERRTAPPNEYDGVVFFGTFDQEFYAVETPDGNEQWSSDLLVRLTPMPAVDDSGVYVSFYDSYYPGGVIGFDRLTGSLLWGFRETPIRTATDTAESAGTSDKETGDSSELNQERSGDKTPQFQPAVALDDDTVYFASTTGVLFAIDKAGGEERWSYETDSQLVDSPTVTQNHVYVGDTGGTVYAFEKDSGANAWTATSNDLSTSNTNFLVSTAIGGVVYVASDRFIVGLDASAGDVLWRHDIPSLFSPPIVAYGRLFTRTRESIIAYAPE